MIDALVYQRLAADATLASLVSSRIVPTLPLVDSPLPYLYYWRLDVQDNMTLSGPIRPASYTFAFDFWSETESTCRSISDALHASLTTWRTTDVRGAFRQTDGREQDERGYHGQSTYQIWY